MSKPVYLDYNATTPTDPRVLEAMQRSALLDFGNPSSHHVHGRRARLAVDEARGWVAQILCTQPEEIVFTSGATESNNLVLLGLADHGRRRGRMHILASSIEHSSVLGPLNVLARQGFDVEYLPVSGAGFVDPDDVRSRLRADTLLVSIMHANNETGVLQPVLEIAPLVAESNALFHVDAAQTFGKEVDELMALDCDFVSISGHKILGPKGVGALYIKRAGRNKAVVSPTIHGGGQEMGLRPGTLPVPLIVGLGVAAHLAIDEHEIRRRCNAALRRGFLKRLEQVHYEINGDLAKMQDHVLNVSFPGVDSKALMMSLRDSIAFADGAACSSGSATPSHVLTAMGLPDDRISSSVRFSWGPGVDQIPFVRLINAVRRLSEHPV
jgi:cysteine desulfurase